MSVPARNLFGPSGTPEPITDIDPRCPSCAAENRGRLLARMLTRPWLIECPRCKAQVYATSKGVEYRPRGSEAARMVPGQLTGPLRRSESPTEANPGA